MYSNRPPCLCSRVRRNICRICKPMPYPILPPSVPCKVLGFVDEEEPREGRARAIDGVREPLSNVCRILGHHRLSESVPSNLDALFCDPNEGFHRLEALPIRGLYPSKILGRL
jgi:hypothetical protein